MIEPMKTEGPKQEDRYKLLKLAADNARKALEKAPVESKQAMVQSIGIKPEDATPKVMQGAQKIMENTAAEAEENPDFDLAKSIMELKAEADPESEKISDKQRIVASAMLAAIPTIAGYLIGGVSGGAAGAKAGSEGVQALNKQFESQDEAERKQRSAIQTLKMKSAIDAKLLPEKERLAQKIMLNYGLTMQGAKSADELNRIKLQQDLQSKNESVRLAAQKELAEMKAAEDRLALDKKLAHDAAQNAANRANKAAQENSKKPDAKKEFEALPIENQKQIQSLAEKQANVSFIKNNLASSFVVLKDNKASPEQKLQTARQMIKTLNSTQGQDAVGSEEAKRLAGFLEMGLMNFIRGTKQPGEAFGTDVGAFTTQIENKIKELDSVEKMNRAQIDKLYGRNSSSEASQTKIINGVTYQRSPEGKWLKQK